MPKPSQSDVSSRRAEAAIEDIRNERKREEREEQQIRFPKEELMDYLRKVGLIR